VKAVTLRHEHYIVVVPKARCTSVLTKERFFDGLKHAKAWTRRRRRTEQRPRHVAMHGDETCHCGNRLLWWRSRSGYRVCMTCCPDPLRALEILARRGRPGLVQQVQSWRLDDPATRERP
jgi:hypothetical protein